MIATPLTAIQDQHSRRLISSDISRSAAWFGHLADELHLSSFLTSDVKLRASRAFAVMTFVIPKFSYTQGYDRFVLISHLLGLDFCGQTSPSPDFAEALSFFLGAELIRLVNIARFLDNPIETEVHFRRMYPDMMI
jgi:hypothetical protein